MKLKKHFHVPRPSYDCAFDCDLSLFEIICCLAGRLKKVLSLFSYTQAGKIAGLVCAKTHVSFASNN